MSYLKGGSEVNDSTQAGYPAQIFFSAWEPHLATRLVSGHVICTSYVYSLLLGLNHRNIHVLSTKLDSRI